MKIEAYAIHENIFAVWNILAFPFRILTRTAVYLYLLCGFALYKVSQGFHYVSNSLENALGKDGSANVMFWALFVAFIPSTLTLLFLTLLLLVVTFTLSAIMRISNVVGVRLFYLMSKTFGKHIDLDLKPAEGKVDERE